MFCDHPLFRMLCGGIHILDFFTRDKANPANPAEPQDIYRTVMIPDWIEFFALQPDIDGILDLLLRTPPTSFPVNMPPSLAAYICEVREHSLRRDFVRRAASERTRRTVGYGTEWALNAGMRPKKIHEVCVCVCVCVYLCVCARACGSVLSSCFLIPVQGVGREFCRILGQSGTRYPVHQRRCRCQC